MNSGKGWFARALPFATLENPHPQKNKIPNELSVISIDSTPGEEPPDDDRVPKGRFPKIAKRHGKSPPQYPPEDEELV